jgi:hypothetical protein
MVPMNVPGENGEGREVDRDQVWTEKELNA